NGAKAIDRKYLERPGHPLAAEVATDISFGIREHFLSRPGDAADVVIELDIRREVAGVLSQLLRIAATVECLEHGRVQRRDGFEQWIRGSRALAGSVGGGERRGAAQRC